MFYFIFLFFKYIYKKFEHNNSSVEYVATGEIVEETFDANPSREE